MEALDDSVDLDLEASLAELKDGLPPDSPELFEDNWSDHPSMDPIDGHVSEAGPSEGPRSSASVISDTAFRTSASSFTQSVKATSDEWQTLLQDRLTSVARGVPAMPWERGFAASVFGTAPVVQTLNISREAKFLMDHRLAPVEAEPMEPSAKILKRSGAWTAVASRLKDVSWGQAEDTSRFRALMRWKTFVLLNVEKI
jgi:hypothetical protein